MGRFILIIVLILLATFFLAFDNEKQVLRRHTQTYPVYLNIGLTFNHLKLVGTSINDDQYKLKAIQFALLIPVLIKGVVIIYGWGATSIRGGAKILEHENGGDNILIHSFRGGAKFLCEEIGTAFLIKTEIFFMPTVQYH